jgi:4-hydroxybenzoyl-CoA thioesterase
MSAADSIFQAEYVISFGDCDPAGIVFYPNIFAWMDRTFHAYLRQEAGGHAEICKALNLKGVGLVSAHCSFRSPLMEGNELIVSMAAIEWSDRFFKVSYSGQVGERVVFAATEERALFLFQDDRLRAGNPTLLKQHLEAF